MISETKLDDWIKIYLRHIDQITPEVHVQKEEGYKFQSVNTFQQHFDINAQNLAENLDRAIEHNNLVAGNMYWPRKMLIIFAQSYEEETRNALRILFDEDGSVAERIDRVETTFNQLMERRNRELGEESHSFISLRFLSLLLGFRHPDIYDAVKPREWKFFCKYIDEEFSMPKGSSSGERYDILRSYIEALRIKLIFHPEIKKLKDQLTRGLEYSDEQFRWMTQDVIFVTSRVIVNKYGQEKPQNSTQVLEPQDEIVEDAGSSGFMEFPLENYLENFLIKNWNNIDFGETLSLYRDEEGAPPQQYPTAQGYIDILAKDENDSFSRN
jgi:hypothetical protein